MVSVDDYLAASYPDGDREYLDGVVMERNVGAPIHSTLQKILIVHWRPSRRGFKLQCVPNAAPASRRHDIVCRTCS